MIIIAYLILCGLTLVVCAAHYAAERAFLRQYEPPAAWLVHQWHWSKRK